MRLSARRCEGALERSRQWGHSWPVSAEPSPATTTVLLSEIFRSLQGEGRHAGAPSVFVRLARCNLSCAWCDTPYSWDFERFDFEREVERVAVEEIVRRVIDFEDRRLVLTGGEPLLQQRAVCSLLRELDCRAEQRGVRRWFVEVETNGTVPPRAELLARVDHWNVSPKLSSSGEPAKRRLRRTALERLRSTGRADLKLVVREEDLAEADELLRWLEWPKDRVVLMPQAADRATLSEQAPLISRAALARKVRFSSRLHIELFDGRRGT